MIARTTLGALAKLLTSVAVLLPCFWLPRIHAGDLSSHVYNAWLVNEVKSGRAPGLHIATQWSNVLFDVSLDRLLPIAGPDLAQRIAVSASVLVFFWGLFAWIDLEAGRAWCIAPALAMLTYGRMFQLGFFNNYLAIGLTFGALALCRGSIRNKCIAVLFLLLALLAHIVGVFIVLAIAAFLWTANRLCPRLRIIATTALISVMIFSRLVVQRIFVLQENSVPLDLFGLGQFLLFGSEFVGIAAAIFAVLVFPIVIHLTNQGLRRTLQNRWFLLLAISLVVSAIVPWGIWLPGYAYALGYLDLRVTLAVVVALLALAAHTSHPRRLTVALSTVAMVYFSCLYLRQRYLDTVEDRLTSAVIALPSGSRVVSSFRAVRQPVDPFVHMVDRACIGRCYSYANYEPASRAFRLRASGPSPIVQSNPAKTRDMEAGRYVVEASDEPLWLLRTPSRPDQLVSTRRLYVGDPLTVQFFAGDAR